VLVRRDTGKKITVSLNQLEDRICEILDLIQKNLFKKAQAFQQQNTYSVETYEEFKVSLEKRPGFYIVYFAGTPDDEEQLKKETKATGRCIPFALKGKAGKCFYTGKETSQRIILRRLIKEGLGCHARCHVFFKMIFAA
jgi:prolyl-tRNA synthetase